jgi:hypothetical protein
LHSIFFCESGSTPVTAGKKDNHRTKQFRACDITFFDAHDNIIPNTSPLHILYTATTTVMRITNQKNNTRGSSRIRHTTSGTKACPVKALGRRVHFIMNHPECNEEDIICTSISYRTLSTGGRHQQNDQNSRLTAWA